MTPSVRRLSGQQSLRIVGLWILAGGVGVAFALSWALFSDARNLDLVSARLLNHRPIARPAISHLAPPEAIPPAKAANLGNPIAPGDDPAGASAPSLLPVYTVASVARPPTIPGHWFDNPWRHVPELSVANFLASPKASTHRPAVHVKLLHDEQALYVFFRVQDRYVVSRYVGLNMPLWFDSCVSFFVQPRPDKPYVTFETNAGGSLLSYLISDPRRDRYGNFLDFAPATPEAAGQVKVFASLPRTVNPEIGDAVEWTIQYTIPRAVLEHYLGPLGTLSGQEWRGNFFKCADGSSHPHWASWSPIREGTDFHQPRYFGTLHLQ